MSILNRSAFQGHPFHLVSPSPWPTFTCASLLSLATLEVLTMHSFQLASYWLPFAFVLFILGMSLWFRDVISEGTYLSDHTLAVQKRLQIEVVLVIISKILFILVLFWGCHYSDSSLADTKLGHLFCILSVAILLVYTFKVFGGLPLTIYTIIKRSFDLVVTLSPIDLYSTTQDTIVYFLLVGAIVLITWLTIEFLLTKKEAIDGISSCDFVFISLISVVFLTLLVGIICVCSPTLLEDIFSSLGIHLYKPSSLSVLPWILPEGSNISPYMPKGSNPFVDQLEFKLEGLRSTTYTFEYRADILFRAYREEPVDGVQNPLLLLAANKFVKLSQPYSDWSGVYFGHKAA